MVLYPIGSTASCSHCVRILKDRGISLVDHPMPEVTHLLLDVPGFTAGGNLRNGERIEHYLQMLPPEITVIGGNLDQKVLEGYRQVDLLSDPEYLCQNAAITADCAVRIAGSRMEFVFQNCPALVIGWGRIGKCLGQMLKALGCRVTVAARKEADRAMLHSLGYAAVDIQEIPTLMPAVRLLFNTVPERIVPQPIPANCIALELASRDGILGDTVIAARGLPGTYAPESAGQLMADTILRKFKEGVL